MDKIIQWKDENAVVDACAVLENGGVIVYPTDTLYGFGCDAKNESAIDTINTIKGRISPMSVLAPDEGTALSWMNLNEAQKQSCQKKLGGQTTIIVPVKSNIVSDKIMGHGHTLGIRIPNHSFCSALSSRYINPITTTSVNRTGFPAMTNPSEIESEFMDEIDLIIDAGIIHGTGSTIYLFENGELTILRQ